MIKKNYLARLVTIIAVALFFVTAAMPKAYGRDGVGIGVIAGEPTGLSVKYWIDRTSAFDAAFSWSLADKNPFQFHADYLMHGPSLNTNSSEAKGSLPWYYGIGGRIKNINNETHLGIRVPVGVTYLVSEAPVDIFAEIAPVLDLKPTVNLNWNGAIGIRYYF
jgi:hypothetical protein